MCKHAQVAKETNVILRNMDGYHQKKQKLALGTKCAAVMLKNTSKTATNVKGVEIFP
jgi:hypothetical protein